MRFTTIELENIFAYDGKVVLDVGGTTGDRNIVLVWGRNGMGKTSLLKAIKLLFLGTEDRNMRSIGFPPTVLTPRQFVLGDGASWSGVINRRAYRLDPDCVARVKVNWEAGNDAASAERRWRKDGASYQESLVVFDGQVRLTAEAAEERLQDFLPRDFVDLFFFDGEEVKALAEMAEGRKAVDFDRVLRTTFITELATELSRIVRERRRALLEESVQEQLASVEAEITRAESAKTAAEEYITGREEELIDCRRELDQLMARRDNLRSGASSAEREELEQRKDQLQGYVREQAEQICKLVPEVAPMIANPGLVSAALTELDERLSRGGSGEQSIVLRIKKALPRWLEEGPPKLDQQMRTTLAGMLGTRLDSLVERMPPSGLFASLDRERAARIRDTLLHFVSPEQRQTHYHLLKDIHRNRLELLQVRETLMELEVGSEATVSAYREVTELLERIQDNIERINQDIGQQKRRLQDAQATLDKRRKEFRQLEKASERATADSRDVKYIGRLARSLSDLREDLRREMRERVMALINEKFRILVHDHDFVRKIELDDTYTLTFMDRNGRAIGRSSLSSGIKQLAATALLWAMKEVPEHEVPVIIDTPLGRIDRENQEHMLLNYYPNLAEQVIVLPTNAEIDERKYELIRNHVAKEYRIRNETGDSASVHVGSLVGLGTKGLNEWPRSI